VNVNDVVGARRRSVAAGAESQLDVPYAKDLIRRRVSRMRHLSNAPHQVSAPRLYGHNYIPQRKISLMVHRVTVLRRSDPLGIGGQADIAWTQQIGRS
jgi:hypothetical protein